MVFIVSFNLLQAQDVYVITKKDFKDKNVSKTMELQFYKGEIYPLSRESGANKFFKVDTSEFQAVNDVHKLADKPIDKSSEKDNFITIIKKNNTQHEDSIHVDLSSVYSISDTIWFAPEKGKPIPFVKNKVVNISVATTGKKFRLIIPNTITIWYDREQLKEFMPPPPPDGDKDGVPDSEDKCPDQFGTKDNYGCTNPPPKPKTAWKLIVKFIAGVIVGIGIVGLFLYRKRNKNRKSGKSVEYVKVPNKQRYTSGRSLSDFAKENRVNLNDLLKWNNIKKTPNKTKQNAISVALEGKDLIIGYEMVNVEQPETPPTDDGVANMGVALSNDDLKKIQEIIRQEIKPLTDKNKENLELAKSDTEAKSRISKLESEKSDLEQEIGTLKDKVKTFSTIANKIITVDFLKTYASEVYEYLKICGTVVDDAFKCYDLFNQQSISPSLLLTNYQTAVCSLPVGKWMQIVLEIKNKGIVVSDERLKQSLSTPVNNEDKQKELQRTLFSEVLVKYSSNVLILAEAFANLSRFPSVTETVINVENTFKKHFETIINHAKSAGLEIIPAHLFINIDDFQEIEAIKRNRSLPYTNIVGLQQDDIAEIVSYGIKTQFQSTKTQIILT
jgi:hypothetical protein